MSPRQENRVLTNKIYSELIFLIIDRKNTHQMLMEILNIHSSALNKRFQPLTSPPYRFVVKKNIWQRAVHEVTYEIDYDAIIKFMYQKYFAAFPHDDSNSEIIERLQSFFAVKQGQELKGLGYYFDFFISYIGWFGRADSEHELLKTLFKEGSISAKQFFLFSQDYLTRKMFPEINEKNIKKPSQ